jgi:hypothetical protein
LIGASNQIVRPRYYGDISRNKYSIIYIMRMKD